jgi:hypothetical protein
VNKKADVVKELPVDGVTEIHGVTCDGSSVWFAADAGDLVQVDPETGAVVSRTPGLGCRAGITFDGETLWVVSGKEIRQLDLATRKVLHSIPTPTEHIAGMAWNQGALFLSAWKEKKILKVDPKTGRTLKSIAVNRWVTGVTFADGELWHGTLAEGDEPGGLRSIDAEGRELGALPMSSGEGVSGLEYDARRDLFWCGQHDLENGDATGPWTKPRLRAVRRNDRASQRAKGGAVR